MSDTKKFSSLMRAVVLVAVLTPLMLNLAACSKKQPVDLTDESLRKFYGAGLAAAANRDANAICAQFADNAEIKTVRFTQSSSDSTTQSKQEICQTLGTGFAQMQAAGISSSAKMDIDNIAIAADGKSADVQTTVTESIQVAGQSASSRTEQTEHIELIGGKPLITKSIYRVTGTQ